MNSLITTNSKFDKGMRKHNNAQVEFDNFTKEENAGRGLFSRKCASCHGGRMITTGQSTANTGLDLEYDDRGIAELTENPIDDGVFKVPLLRNVELTGPYMHDGRFETLEEVVEHYSSGIKSHPNLDFQLPAGGMNFTEQEKEDLVSFLKTLTDTDFTTAVRFSDPFKQ
ncbi:MAG: c-type cytochrome [Bacteroidota bacterium]